MDIQVNPNDANMLAQLAWNITRPDGDPRWEGVIQSHRDKLLTHANDVIKTGNAVTDFEKEVLRLRSEALEKQTTDNEQKFKARREEELEIMERRKQSVDVMAREAAIQSRLNSGVPAHALHAEDVQKLEDSGANIGREQGFDQTDAVNKSEPLNPLGQRPSVENQPSTSVSITSGSAGNEGNSALDANRPIEPEGSEQAEGENDGTGDEPSTESPKPDNEKLAKKSSRKSSKRSKASKEPKE